jgi:hypothetical protein
MGVQKERSEIIVAMPGAARVKELVLPFPFAVAWRQEARDKPPGVLSGGNA